jgi:hypothetical protein
LLINIVPNDNDQKQGRMPFFLVTYTGLVEADDEAAAQQAVSEIRSGRALRVTVKSDEITSNSLTIPARADDEGERTQHEAQVSPPGDSASMQDPLPFKDPVLQGGDRSRRALIFVRCATLGIIALLVMAYLIA